jgi:ubiquitin C-terminal hydrolase
MCEPKKDKATCEPKKDTSEVLVRRPPAPTGALKISNPDDPVRGLHNFGGSCWIGAFFQFVASLLSEKNASEVASAFRSPFKDTVTSIISFIRKEKRSIDLESLYKKLIQLSEGTFEHYNVQSDPLELLNIMVTSQHDNNGKEPLDNIFRVGLETTTKCDVCPFSTTTIEYFSTYAVHLPPMSSRSHQIW